MKRSRRVTAVLGALVLALALLAGPALATEAGDAGDATTQTEEGQTGGAGADDDGKIELPDRSRDQFGLALIVLLVLGALLALDNARRQLRGERGQADGKWRYR